MKPLPHIRAVRLDQKVTEQLPTISRAFAAKLIEQGKVSVNSKVITKRSYTLRAGERLTIDYDPTTNEALHAITLPILYEDSDCIVINKPSGVLVHSKGAFNPEATVTSWLKSRTKGLAGERAGIVHRLDRATSGVMICAKTPEALIWLQKQFSQRKAKKTYVALIVGQLEPPAAVIDMPIERNPKAPATFRVGSNGKPAVTTYETPKVGTMYSMLVLQPQTGRTHQLRVHLKQLGHPIVGDTIYGGKPAERLYLHAKELVITLPNKQRQTFVAPLPRQFQTTLNER